MHRFIGFVSAALILSATQVYASPATLRVTVEGIAHGKPIPESQALCIATPDGKSRKLEAIARPKITWTGAPEGTDSFAVFMMDPDVPAVFTDANKDGKILASAMKRMAFYHYGVTDIPSSATELNGGDALLAPTEGIELANDLGANNYVPTLHTYGGPCPPWNDARIHHYHFIVLALDSSAREALGAYAEKGEVLDAKRAFDTLMGSKHVLAKGTVVGTYSLNKELLSVRARK